VLGTVSVFLDRRHLWKRRMAVVTFSAAMASLVLVVFAVALYEILGPGLHSILRGA
jgi:hypothetical protein